VARLVLASGRRARPAVASEWKSLAEEERPRRAPVRPYRTEAGYRRGQEISVLVPVVSTRVDALVRVLVGLFKAVRVLVLVDVLVRVKMAVTSPVAVRVLMLMRMLMIVLVHDRLLCKSQVA